jgi:aspartyl-tRNA(Asn)/glutamyl-tRNA(Gln) amidotransferase subunit A
MDSPQSIDLGFTRGRRYQVAEVGNIRLRLNANSTMRSLAEIATELEAGTKSATLVEECLARIADPTGEGARTFLKVHAEPALAAADLHDLARARRAAPSRFAGIPVSVKDLFDLAGDVTTAGSIVLRDAAPARRDAHCIARLKTAGFVPIGRTNMTEFAFSGLGINPHYGTPLNPYDRASGRIPGGSSSGAAVSVTDGMAFAALGTDTGGSCRIPAAFCGIVGFKPTARRVPLEGTFPLSVSLDSVGPLAPTVACCAALDAVLAGLPASELPEFPLAGLRLAVPQTLVLDDLEPAVARAFDASLAALRGAGARVVELALREFAELPQLNAKGGLSAPESYAVHRPLIAARERMYDPRVLARVLRGQEQDASDYIELIRARTDFIGRLELATAPYDALALPTVPIVAPRLDAFESDEVYRRINMLVLRNPSIANFLDRCSISIPCHEAGEAPIGFMLIGEHGADRRLLSIAAAVEKVVAPV